MLQWLLSRFAECRRTLEPFRRDRPWLAQGVAIGVLLLLVVSLVWPAWYIVGLRRGLPGADELSRIGEMDQATAVFDGDDQPAFTIFKEQRLDVPLERVSPFAVNAIVAIEDQRFYSHHGFDWVRMGSAALANVRHRRLAQGASTLTQQLARMSFLTPDKTFRRKLQELMLARRIEGVFSKRDILELYLNKSYFGDGLYGIEAASRGYFGKSASDLSLAESALLAGLVKSPSTYAPTVRLDRAVARRTLVLKAMREMDVIDQSQWEHARTSGVDLKDTLRADAASALYFKEQVRQELVERFGWQRVYQGGLRVYSTIDMTMQRAAETAVQKGLQSLDARRAAVAKRRGTASSPEDAPLQAALIAMEPATGRVRAMVGGRDFDQSRFNRAVQARRQPGSAFKPFVYAAALEAGFTPATMIENLNAPIATLQGAWTPADEHGSDEAMSMRMALRTSSNRAAVRLLQDVGIPRTVQYAKSMGVGDVPSVPSLALGTGEVTLQSLTAAYAGFANRGDVPRPIVIRRVEDRDGQVLYVAKEQVTHAISATTAYLMANMMADVINSGTGAGARTLGFTLPAAGKTGTTNDYNDAWFVGFTPSIVAGVWVGFDQPKTILPGGFAAQVAVPVWASFMKAATKGAKAEWFSAPDGIVTATICPLTGQLASGGCVHAYTESFARGTVPTAYCDQHPVPSVVGAIAAVFTLDEQPVAPLFDRPAPARPALSMTGASGPLILEERQTPKKRGFWSRVLGRGKRQDEAKDRDR